MKQCSKCKQIKELNEFTNCHTSKDGKYSYCKLCLKLWREKNKEEISIRRKISYQENREDRLTQKQEYWLRNREWLKVKHREQYYANREAVLRQKKEYSQRPEVKVQRRISSKTYVMKKYNSNPTYKFRHIMSKNLRTAFRVIGASKGARRTLNILGYTGTDLYKHLSKFYDKPCLGRCGTLLLENDKVEIDHIIPVTLSRTKEDVIKLNQLINLRLLCRNCNRRKGYLDKKLIQELRVLDKENFECHLNQLINNLK